MRKKIAQFCNVAPDAVIQSVDAKSIYDVPILMHEQHLDEIVMRKLDMNPAGAAGYGTVERIPDKNAYSR